MAAQFGLCVNDSLPEGQFSVYAALTSDSITELCEKKFTLIDIARVHTDEGNWGMLTLLCVDAPHDAPDKQLEDLMREAGNLMKSTKRKVAGVVRVDYHTRRQLFDGVVLPLCPHCVDHPLINGSWLLKAETRQEVYERLVAKDVMPAEYAQQAFTDYVPPEDNVCDDCQDDEDEDCEEEAAPTGYAMNLPQLGTLSRGAIKDFIFASLLDEESMTDVAPVWVPLSYIGELSVHADGNRAEYSVVATLPEGLYRVSQCYDTYPHAMAQLMKLMGI